MPASDVYSWAKASTKPSYKWNEVGIIARTSVENIKIDSTGSCLIQQYHGSGKVPDFALIYPQLSVHWKMAFYNYDNSTSNVAIFSVQFDSAYANQTITIRYGTIIFV